MCSRKQEGTESIHAWILGFPVCAIVTVNVSSLSRLGYGVLCAHGGQTSRLVSLLRVLATVFLFFLTFSFLFFFETRCLTGLGLTNSAEAEALRNLPACACPGLEFSCTSVHHHTWLFSWVLMAALQHVRPALPL